MHSGCYPVFQQCLVLVSSACLCWTQQANKKGSTDMRVERFLGLFAIAALTVCLFGCGGYGGSSTTPPPTPPTSVTISPASASVAANGGMQGFTAMVGNDYLRRGVTRSLSAMRCSGATCGSLTAMTSSAVTYNAPAAVSQPPTVTPPSPSPKD